MVKGQSENVPNSFTYKVLGVDTYSPYLEDLYRFDKQTFAFSAEYSRYLRNSLSLSFPFRLGTMSYPHDVKDFHSGISFYAQDVALKYGFSQVAGKKIQPYISAGVGLLYLSNIEKTIGKSSPIENNWEGQFPIELGINYQILDGISLQLSTAYRFSTGADAWHNGIGIQFQFRTKKDEAIISNTPSSSRSLENNNYTNLNGDFLLTLLDDHHASLSEIEDNDGDGIPNSYDLCPNEAGDENFGGCPLLDDDNDGLANHEDRCPNEAGDIAFAGCPDTDGDRIADVFDLCPNEAGTRACKGCPDIDNDNIPDAIDKCPTEAGRADNEGCPIIPLEDKLTLKGSLQPILFQNEQYYLDRVAVENLDHIILLMNRYPKAVLSISGIAYDNETAGANEILSIKRAESCFQYLTKMGISEDRITYQGLGNLRAVSANHQRCVQFQLFMN